jgi:SAM-dependent methyltransferase
MSREFPSMHIDYCRASAENLPFASKSFDGIITFNAVHHFNLDRFVIRASGVLRPGGLLSIYTRTPEQNGRTVWGQYFPGFAERETRLYSFERLEEVVGRTSGFHMEGIHEFKNVRAESVESLLNRARNFHYSTFALYPRQEFMRAVETFAQSLNEISRSGLVEHTAENTLVLARRD